MTTSSPASPTATATTRTARPFLFRPRQVTPNAGLSATYTNYPQEFRFVYTNVPSSGTATITVRLKEFATSVYTNRYTILTTTVNTLAPTQVVEISAPATDGTVLTYTQQYDLSGARLFHARR